MQVLRPENIETGKPKIKMTADKYQDKYNFIPIFGMIKETEPPILLQLDNGTCMHCKPIPFLGYNNSTSDLEKGGR